MRQIRRNVFETNSSSTHSISFSANGREPSKFVLDKDGYLWCDYGDWDGEYGYFNDQYEKLSYLLTLCYFASGMGTYCNDLRDFSDFKELEEAICEYTGAKGIKIRGAVEPTINHQTLPEYNWIDFINVWDHDAVINFVFNKDISLNIGRD